MKKPNGNAGIPILGQKQTKPTDVATIANVEAFLTQALKKQDEIHNFYLQQIPTFVARMVQDALIGYGLIAMTPVAPAEPDAPSTTAPCADDVASDAPLVQ